MPPLSDVVWPLIVQLYPQLESLPVTVHAIPAVDPVQLQDVSAPLTTLQHDGVPDDPVVEDEEQPLTANAMRRAQQPAAIPYLCNITHPVLKKKVGLRLRRVGREEAEPDSPMALVCKRPLPPFRATKARGFRLRGSVSL